MKRIKKIFSSKAFIMLVWAVLLIVVWELCALNVEHTKRTPENVLPHISGIVDSIFSTKKSMELRQLCRWLWKMPVLLFQEPE